MKKEIIIGILMLGVLIIAGCGSSGVTGDAGVDITVDTSGGVITVFKSPNCGCCVGYISELKSSGFSVKTVSMDDINPIKEKYGVPMGMGSCHTAVVGNYFVEGHVPIEAIDKLLEEKPDIDGIALPNMPSGSPGMPGAKTKDWVIYGVKDGQTSEFMVI